MHQEQLSPMDASVVGVVYTAVLTFSRRSAMNENKKVSSVCGKEF